MKPLRLYIKDFMCYENSFIDFTKFNSALIIGEYFNNKLYSNGVGKTTIFKAIEYVLFNQSDFNLENIIRDDTDYCQVVFDFFLDKEYRIIRKRTKKGSTDLSLYEKISDEASYHKEINGVNIAITDKKNWKDISGSRSTDTEKELEKIIKINYKSFRSVAHFVQNDVSGLAAVAPEKRKTILKEPLNLAIYSKLEKIAKDEYNALSKEIEKNYIIIENLGNPAKDLIDLSLQLSQKDQDLDNKQSESNTLNSELCLLNEQVNNLKDNFSIYENKLSTFIAKKNFILENKIKIEKSIKEYVVKKQEAIKLAKELIQEIKDYNEKAGKLPKDFSEIEVLKQKISDNNEKLINHNFIIKNYSEKYNELKIPMPDNDVCKNCRQELTAEHRIICQKKIDEEMLECQANIQNSTEECSKINSKILNYQKSYNTLVVAHQQLENIKNGLCLKEKDLKYKKSLYNEHCSTLDALYKDLEVENKELEIIEEQLKQSSSDELDLIKCKIIETNKNISFLNNKIVAINKEIILCSNQVALVKNSIENKNKDLNKINDTVKILEILNKDFSIYPSVLQAFSSYGIPNLIIQNVLDDLQIEANNLLSQLKPGLQLQFIVEKSKKDVIEDTLDIVYYANGKKRYYEQLSGAMKLSVLFSLKLGLSFVLQKMFGVDVKFLLLDEIDQSLDKASVDSFADIIKFFQKDFTILVITHNDRLKDKFSHTILVEQDINAVSKAKLIKV